ncbi:MAG: GCN5-related N-acetyltransferase [Candidatus Paceibacter sp.]|jgi:RimJ/RimL family protein N-acetyltransferase|nr:GCN5-related N-acetyltransferase [Candidatus Paceibacter sp.]
MKRRNRSKKVATTRTKQQQSKQAPRIVFRMGKRIYLRPVLKEDLPFITAGINDPEITKYLMVAYPMPLLMEEKWYERMTEDREKQGENIIFAIVFEKTDEIIGVMGLHKIDHKNGLATTGTMIFRKDCWSQGYGTEAKMLVLEYAFNTLNLRKICSHVYDFNPRSMRALEKCGYKREGIRKQHYFRNGRFADDHMFAVFKEDFFPLWDAYSKKYFGK